MYLVQEQAHVAVTVYNSMGVEMKKLVAQEHVPGTYGVEWDGHSEAGRKCPAGIYNYTLQYGQQVVSKKLVIKE